VRLLLLRHGIAEDPAGGRSDRERALTEEGRRKLKKGTEAIARLVPELALVASSPLVRTRQSAEILAGAYGKKPVVSDLADLAPAGASAGVLRFVQAQKALAAVALVGHEPNLSELAGLLLAGKERGFVEMKKGGACLFDFPGRIAPGGAILLWHLTPGLLRDLR
jgi:phosphohistidine phosphatase